MSIENPTLSAAADLAHYRHYRHFYPLYPSTTVEIALQIHSFMQNKPNFRNDKMNINTLTIMRYVNLDTWLEEKTNPIQTQSKPILGQYQGWQSQTNPIVERAKNESFCVDKKFYDDINHATREIYHPKGCQFNPIKAT